ncbi:hypothetical protein ACH4SP_22985 [Streptomyces sp. NPDC021093]|uniref:hypothetical protein n=1 Tax=Streptomyces sp. NPDC021093 TaxID=3365112 RepID=UPI00379D0846
MKGKGPGAAACAVFSGYGVLCAGLVFFAVRWGYPVGALCALVALAALGLGVIGRLMYIAGRPERRWFRWERVVGGRLALVLYAATVPFVIIEITDGDRPDWGRFSSGVALLALLAMQGGQSWKDDDRVRELLAEGERLKVAVPVRWSRRTSLWRRAVQGSFVVFTDRRVLLFAYHRFLDVPVARPLWGESSADCVAMLRVADRRLVLTEAGAGAGAGVQEFKVAARRKTDLERYALRMARV